MQDQLSNDLAWLTVCAAYGLFVAPALVRCVFALCMRIVLHRRLIRSAPREIVRRSGMLPRLDSAIEEFGLPFTCREALGERLLKAQILAGVTAVLIGCPALLLFFRTGLDIRAADGTVPGINLLATTIVAVILFQLAAIGGAIRVYGPRLGIPLTRMVCKALVTAYQVRCAKAPSSKLDSAISAMAAVLMHRARKYHVRQERPSIVEHANRVCETLRRDAERVRKGENSAVDDIASKLTMILHGLCAGTPQNLLPDNSLVPTRTPTEPKRRVAVLMALGIALACGFAWALEWVGVPVEVVVPLSLIVFTFPIYLGGPSELLKVRDLLDFASGGAGPAPSEPPSQESRANAAGPGPDDRRQGGS